MNKAVAKRNGNRAAMIPSSLKMMDQWWDDLLRPMGLFRKAISEYAPRSNIEETNAYYFLSVDLPGVLREDVRIDVSDDTVVVSGERVEECTNVVDHNHVHECFNGRFQRSFNLPAPFNADKVEAQFKDGVLRIAVPKMEPAKGRRVNIEEGVDDFFETYLPRDATKKTTQGRTSTGEPHVA